MAARGSVVSPDGAPRQMVPVSRFLRQPDPRVPHRMGRLGRRADAGRSDGAVVTTRARANGFGCDRTPREAAFRPQGCHPCSTVHASASGSGAAAWRAWCAEGVPAGLPLEQGADLRPRGLAESPAGRPAPATSTSCGTALLSCSPACEPMGADCDRCGELRHQRGGPAPPRMRGATTTPMSSGR